MALKEKIVYNFFNMQTGRKLLSYLRCYYNWEAKNGVILYSKLMPTPGWIGTPFAWNYADGQIKVDLTQNPMTSKALNIFLKALGEHYEGRWLQPQIWVGRRKPVARINTGARVNTEFADFGESMIMKFGTLRA